MWENVQKGFDLDYVNEVEDRILNGHEGIFLLT